MGMHEWKELKQLVCQNCGVHRPNGQDGNALDWGCLHAPTEGDNDRAIQFHDIEKRLSSELAAGDVWQTALGKVIKAVAWELAKGQN